MATDNVMLQLSVEHFAANPNCLEREPLKEIPAAAADYRHLDEGYASFPVHPAFEHRQCQQTGHNALYATKAFKAGDIMCDFGPKAILDSPNYLTVQVAEDKHILLSPEWLQYCNHSCNPNVFFNTATFKFEALQDVAPGDELGFFYPSTEWSMESPFQCRCGHSQCVGWVAGASQLEPKIVDRYRLTDFINGKLNKASSP